jgi:hypothetical protein
VFLLFYEEIGFSPVIRGPLWLSLTILKIKRNLGCRPSSHVIVGREKQNVASNKVEGILTSIYIRKREGPWRCYHPL